MFQMKGNKQNHAHNSQKHLETEIVGYQVPIACMFSTEHYFKMLIPTTWLTCQDYASTL